MLEKLRPGVFLFPKFRHPGHLVVMFCVRRNDTLRPLNTNKVNVFRIQYPPSPHSSTSIKIHKMGMFGDLRLPDARPFSCRVFKVSETSSRTPGESLEETCPVELFSIDVVHDDHDKISERGSIARLLAAGRE